MEYLFSVILVILGTAAGLLLGRFVIRPLINKKNESKKDKKKNKKNTK